MYHFLTSTCTNMQYSIFAAPRGPGRIWEKVIFFTPTTLSFFPASPQSHDCIPINLLLFATVGEELLLTTEQDGIALLPLSIFISGLK